MLVCNALKPGSNLTFLQGAACTCQLLGCHGLPSLKWGWFFFYWDAMGYPVLKLGWLFFPVFSREKLHFLRHIACIINNDAAAVRLARLENRHNNLIEGSTRRRATWTNSCGRHSSLCFSFAELLSFRAVNSIYSRITFLVAMFAVPGCA